MKICRVCLKEKQLDGFGNRKNSIDGKRHQCKDCIRAYNKKWREDNRGYVKVYLKKWREDNLDKRKNWEMKNREKINQQKKERRGSNPERYRKDRRDYYANNKKKVAARKRVHQLMIKGNLIRGDCSYPNGKCRGRIEAHHWDYNKPEDIVWFCKKHHVIADQVQRLIPNPQYNS